MQFSTLGLSSAILRALSDEGYTIPTPIQSQAIPPVMEGRDLLGCAQTGTGKTAAFALPIIHRLTNPAPGAPAAAAPASAHGSRRGPGARARALILSPTRELAAQIGESFGSYGRHARLSHTVIFGGVSQFHQEKALRRGVDVIVATPGRLMDLMNQGLVDLSAVEVFVLDEADRMLDMGFIQPIRKIASLLPTKRQTLLFSATMPREIQKLAESLLRKDHVNVAVTPVASAAPLIEQSVYMSSRGGKQALLEDLLRGPGVTRALVFTRTKHGAERLSRNLRHAGVASEAIHGNKSQNQRLRALASFRDGGARVLVATDVAARGLDVDGVSHVFNFDLPVEAEAYVHRIGRTGRAGATGIAISFCDHDERGLLRAIEKLTQSRLNVVGGGENGAGHEHNGRNERNETRHAQTPRPRQPHGATASSGAQTGHAQGRGGAPASHGHAPRHGQAGAGRNSKGRSRGPGPGGFGGAGRQRQGGGAGTKSKGAAPR